MCVILPALFALVIFGIGSCSMTRLGMNLNPSIRAPCVLGCHVWATGPSFYWLKWGSLQIFALAGLELWPFHLCLSGSQNYRLEPLLLGAVFLMVE
jgi:hypothetical protein